MVKRIWMGGLLALLAGGAAAQSGRGVYVAAGAGAGYAPNGSFDGAASNVDFDLGRPIGMLALGFDTGSGWRFELDAAYRYNDAEAVFFDDGRADLAPDADSRIAALGVAASALYGIELGRGFRPYLGAGAGVARIDYELRQFITGVEVLDDRDTALTYQLIAGFGLNLSPRLDLSADYRFWEAPEIELDSADGSVETAHRVHSVTVNLRYRLSGRAPAPVRQRRSGQGWYVSASLGPSFAKDAEIKNNIANFDAFDVGSVMGVAAGFDWPGPWRAEIELSNRRNEAELVDFNPEFGEDRADGRVEARSLMANVVYEPRWHVAFQPYALLGVGMAHADWRVRLDGDGSIYVDDDDRAEAFQVAFGAAAPITSRLTVTAEYRYWMTALFDFAEPDGRPLRTEHTVHAVMLGVRFTPGA